MIIIVLINKKLLQFVGYSKNKNLYYVGEETRVKMTFYIIDLQPGDNIEQATMQLTKF